jgi:hypothetical protein
LAVVTALAFVSCGGEEGGVADWRRDPIVPGYSMAEVNIGDTFSAVRAVHGDPNGSRRDRGYIFAYYGRLSPQGDIDAPEVWNLVVTLYDNGNGYLDDGDEVGAVEVSGDYQGKTAGGNGLGSPASRLEEEFGSCPGVSEAGEVNEEKLTLYSYSERGVEFLVSEDRGVITVMVTAYGGLRPVEEEEEGEEGQGGLFGAHQSDPIVPGRSVAGINVGDEFARVKELYGKPDSTGVTTEGWVYATYTGGFGSWKLNLYLEDKDGGGALDDYDVVVSISVRHPYAGKTAGGVGVGSPQAEVVREFGTPERQTSMWHQGEETLIMEYNSKGLVFAVNAASLTVVEVDVNRPL